MRRLCWLRSEIDAYSATAVARSLTSSTGESKENKCRSRYSLVHWFFFILTDDCVALVADVLPSDPVDE
jgi:hypothetical protein